MSNHPKPVFTSVAPAYFKPTQLQTILNAYSIGVGKGYWKDYTIDCANDFTCVTTFTGDGDMHRSFTMWDNTDLNDGYAFSVQDVGGDIFQTNTFQLALERFQSIGAAFEPALAIKRDHKRPDLRVV